MHRHWKQRSSKAFGARIREQIVGRGDDNALANSSFILTHDIPTDWFFHLAPYHTIISLWSTTVPGLPREIGSPVGRGPRRKASAAARDALSSEAARTSPASAARKGTSESRADEARYKRLCRHRQKKMHDDHRNEVVVNSENNFKTNSWVAACLNWYTGSTGRKVYSYRH